MNNKAFNLFLTVFGAITSLIGLFKEQNTFLVIIGVICIVAACWMYIQSEKISSQLQRAKLVIEGIYITCLNVANITRGTDLKVFKIHHAIHTGIVNGSDLEVEYEYQGTIINDVKKIEGFSFSLDSDNFIPFNQLDCYGYDLKNDPNKAHKIKPILEAADGNSKKILLPFIRGAKKNEPFHVFLYCKFNNCMNIGKDYFSSTLSFNEEIIVDIYDIVLKFSNPHPEWVRLYEIKNNMPQLIKTIVEFQEEESKVIYKDSYQDIKSKKQLIYFFLRNY